MICLRTFLSSIACDAMNNLQLPYDVAMSIPKPFVRLCADILPDPPISAELYGAAKEIAGIRADDGYLFMIGPYSAALMPAAELHLREHGVPYSDMRVDGIGNNGRVINLALWLQRRDLELTSPISLGKSFAW